ncbi:DUF5376 domain-containing protein [Pasteurella multocida]|uniref:UPF0275 protein PM0493 n=4 Tax=Pasteurella multocida TaxID=747 RepID=Y493_PASMU|nr:DUF5376 domain-containing protein [Pasteurella multocida]Q9CND9.1 RecName: Full=UPF0275 protein PM0493 [Pasteurella multocida subsp. multocida str. Pm70]AAK02577.1 unknown [Pasteurella multocida subsp. multocida str. Pm70]APW55099.1 hypothetical protein PMCN07_0514 [Pasteurella multocida subsp. multocida str. HN07]ARA69338.1 hypothetical protein BTV67_01810 [Pasteurella multocida subsp. multocida]ARA88849.1 hypothetical protein BTV66_04200 [Pasteurella multocida subsp. septica]AUL53156.1 h
MKLVFSHVYDKSGNYIFPYCSPEESTIDYDSEEYVSRYITFHPNDVLEELYDESITNRFIGVDEIEALIDYENVKIGHWLYEEGCELEDYDPEETTYVVISRKELIYLLEKWDEFLAKPIIDPHYQEIIDTKEAYL